LTNRNRTEPSNRNSSGIASNDQAGTAKRWSWVELGRLAVVGIELGLLLLLIRTFSIENTAFFRVFALAAGGFVVHALLPLRLRLPFFVLLSLAAVAVVFGPFQGAWLVALGMVLIALAHLPVRFALRVALVLAVGGLLALLRAGALSVPWSSGIWPIFGAMFMFRMIVYLYDLKNRAAPFGLWRGMGYFFMLPNVCFPLFPVVDYKTFSLGHYRSDAFETYQTGVNWIFRGLIQLLLYRLVYQYLSVDPTSIDSAGGAALYFVYTYLLYLRISGSFHLVIGMMHLFGFSLPRTNYYYFLASSFTDYWRRINIYWKDFLQKIFFNPFYFRFSRRMNGTAAIVLATCVAFFATWALHSYQWFWIRGTFPVIWQDIAFWTVMGLLVMANMLYENRRGRRRSLKKTAPSFGSAVGLGLRTVGTFIVVCTSWAVWSAESFGQLELMVGKLMRPDAASAAWILAGLIGLGVAAVVFDRFDRRGRIKGEGFRIRLFRVPIPVSAFRVSVVSAGLAFLIYAQLYFYYPPSVANVLTRIKNPLVLSGRDSQLLDRGYYEDLTDVARFNPQLAELFAERPPDWNRCWAVHRTGGFPTHEFLPSREIMFKGAKLTTNRWGMRDRDYSKEKPEGTYRFVLSGASHAMGTGVEDDESFENIVEDELNRELAPKSGIHYEILNLSVGGYGPVARLADLQARLSEFDPDALIVVGINDMYWVSKEVVEAATGIYEIPYTHLVEIARSAGVEEGMEFVVAETKLKPHRDELLLWVYRQTVQLCQQQGILPIATFIPLLARPTSEIRDDIMRQTELAKEAGFDVVDIQDAYDGAADLNALWIARWDRHPNAEAHRMLAEKLYPGLVRELDLERAGPGGARAGTQRR
jgi:D-alanyl-lipoteichoic acid acyltransferase DltB (MBOAT superfamily)